MFGRRSQPSSAPPSRLTARMIDGTVQRTDSPAAANVKGRTRNQMVVNSRPSAAVKTRLSTTTCSSSRRRTRLTCLTTRRRVSSTMTQSPETNGDETAFPVLSSSEIEKAKGVLTRRQENRYFCGMCFVSPKPVSFHQNPFRFRGWGVEKRMKRKRRVTCRQLTEPKAISENGTAHH